MESHNFSLGNFRTVGPTHTHTYKSPLARVGGMLGEPLLKGAICRIDIVKRQMNEMYATNLVGMRIPKNTTFMVTNHGHASASNIVARMNLKRKKGESSAASEPKRVTVCQMGQVSSTSCLDPSVPMSLCWAPMRAILPGRWG